MQPFTTRRKALLARLQRWVLAKVSGAALCLPFLDRTRVDSGVAVVLATRGYLCFRPFAPRLSQSFHCARRCRTVSDGHLYSLLVKKTDHDCGSHTAKYRLLSHPHWAIRVRGRRLVFSLQPSWHWLVFPFQSDGTVFGIVARSAARDCMSGILLDLVIPPQAVRASRVGTASPHTGTRRSRHRLPGEIQSRVRLHRAASHGSMDAGQIQLGSSDRDGRDRKS